MIEQVMPKPSKGSKTKRETKETFSFNDPNAHHVLLVGDFTDWEDNALPMKKQKNGTWKATVTLEPGTYEYRFLVDGVWQDDIDCPERRPNGFGAENCIREVI
jgi:1,4-alpha-glucan branching enzyme